MCVSSERPGKPGYASFAEANPTMAQGIYPDRTSTKPIYMEEDLCDGKTELRLLSLRLLDERDAVYYSGQHHLRRRKINRSHIQPSPVEPVESATYSATQPAAYSATYSAAQPAAYSAAHRLSVGYIGGEHWASHRRRPISSSGSATSANSGNNQCRFGVRFNSGQQCHGYFTGTDCCRRQPYESY